MLLKEKIQESILLLQKAENLALQYQDYGFLLAFSGGKDSIVLYELAAMSGVTFKAVMNLTTIDPPELMRYIRLYYPSVIFNHPEINFYDLIIKKNILPTRQIRYCCQFLKEQSGESTVTLLGIRKEESAQRKKRNQIEISNRKFSNTWDQFNITFKENVSCIKGKDKIMINPILDWSFSDIWKFIKEKKLHYCELYDQGYSRIGCVFCPMTSVKHKILDRKKYPKIEQKIKKSIQVLIDTHENYFDEIILLKNESKVDAIFDWWISNDSVSIFNIKRNNKLLF